MGSEKNRLTPHAYYNENDAQKAAWLRELMRVGVIATGDVDERDIRDVAPRDLAGYTQHHFFAGIGGWSYALRLAGIRDDEPFWTGSCPCQPYSASGKGQGADDDRNLWWAWRWLIAQRRPARVAGEQVANAIRKHGWLDLVSTDFEDLAYAVQSTVLPAACVGQCPQERHRLWFLSARLDAGDHRGAAREWWDRLRLAGADSRQRHGRAVAAGGHQPAGADPGRPQDDGGAARGGKVRGVVNGRQPRLEGLAWDGADGLRDEREVPRSDGPAPEAGAAHGLDGGPAAHDRRWSRTDHGGWTVADWLFCRDGWWRPVEPESFPLAHGLPARVGRLRGYGDAIVPQVAALFLEEALAALNDLK